jgi:hypothetical protein
MRDVREIVNSDIAQTKAIFAKHIEKITLTPNGEHYLAWGRGILWAGGSIGGAGGGNWTERLLVRFAWLAA